MNLWSVFVTGLLAGGASCAAVQGGLLAGAVARRRQPTPASGVAVTTDTPRAPARDDLGPVGAFLGGKLLSHTRLGAFLGGVGEAITPGFRLRAVMQVGAGIVMVLMAAHLLGVRGLRRLALPTPPRLARFVRRSARSEAAFAPAVVGFLTVLIPCGVTLSVMFLAVASGSPALGALGMAIFVLGTSPLFAVLGYTVRRSSTLLRGRLAKAAAVAVAVSGLLSINSGLVLGGAPVTLESAWADITGRGSDEPMAMDSHASPEAGAAMVDATGVQHILIEVGETSFSPARVRAKAGVPTRLTLRTDGIRGCTSTVVIPKAGVEQCPARDRRHGHRPRGAVRREPPLHVFNGHVRRGHRDELREAQARPLASRPGHAPGAGFQIGQPRSVLVAGCPTAYPAPRHRRRATVRVTRAGRRAAPDGVSA